MKATNRTTTDIIGPSEKKVLSFLSRTTPQQTVLSISKALNVSTYSVWKSLKKLEEYGITTFVPLSASGKISSHSFIKVNETKSPDSKNHFML